MCHMVINTTTSPSSKWIRTKFAGKRLVKQNHTEMERNLSHEETLEQVLREHDEVFQDKLGT